MGLLLKFDGNWDSLAKKEIEDAIRKRISEPPEDENWVVWATTGLSQNYCDVQVTTPRQTRSRIFFEDVDKLPKAIVDWLGMYPLR